MCQGGGLPRAELWQLLHLTEQAFARGTMNVELFSEQNTKSVFSLAFHMLKAKQHNYSLVQRETTKLTTRNALTAPLPHNQTILQKVGKVTRREAHYGDGVRCSPWLTHDRVDARQVYKEIPCAHCKRDYQGHTSPCFMTKK